jgi:hypothetical protein
MAQIQAVKKSELSFDEVVAKYPDIPKLIIIKTDVARRGVFYTDQALSVLDPKLHSITGTHIFGMRDGKTAARPESLLLRDGTSIFTTPTPLEQNPYIVDLLDGAPFLFEGEKALEPVDYWPVPDYYWKTSSSGVPMQSIVSSRPQRLIINPYRYCTFWSNQKGCSFCDIVKQLKTGKEQLNIPARLDPVEVGEVVGEALKEPGRYSAIFLTAGSITSGHEPFDDEVDMYIDILREVGRNFATRKFPSQLIGTAFTRAQLERLYNETGLLSYTADLEVLNEELFNAHCPGKAEWIGYREWKRRLVDAVDIFGRGFVNTGLVAGIELTKPYGFSSEDEALESALEEAEDLAGQGVSTVYIVWGPRPGSRIGDQKNASLDYYIGLAKGLHELRLKYRLPIMFDDYRHCGNHPDTDLSRLLPF